MASIPYFSTGGPPHSSTVTNKINDTALSSTVSNIIGLKGQKDVDEANATAAQWQATGAGYEDVAYGNVAAIAKQNSVIEGVSGQIQGLQAARKLSDTVGAAQAQSASNGFATAGSSVDVLKSSLQQGYLQQQIINTQTAIAQGGYLEEAAGAEGSQMAARAAASSATALSASYTTAAATAAQNAADETSALQDYIGGTTLTPAQQLTLSPLGITSSAPGIKKFGTGDGIGGSSDPGTASGYARNSSVSIGGKTFATDSEGRVVIQNKF